MATDRDALRAAIDALEEIALAGMSGSGQESEEGMRDWHARQAWKFIGIAARALEPARAALSSAPAAEPVVWLNPATLETIPHDSKRVFEACPAGSVAALKAGMFTEPLYAAPPPAEPAPQAVHGFPADEFQAACDAINDANGVPRRTVSTQPAPQAGAAEPALRPDIQAVLLELDVPVQGYLASHAGTFLKHAAMMPPEEYPIPLVRESDHRRACRKIAALATHPTEQPSQ